MPRQSFVTIDGEEDEKLRSSGLSKIPVVAAPTPSPEQSKNFMQSILSALSQDTGDDNSKKSKENFWTSDKLPLFLDALGSNIAPDNPFAGIATGMINKEEEERKQQAIASETRKKTDLDNLKTASTIRGQTAESRLKELELKKAMEPLSRIKDSQGREYEVPKDQLLNAREQLSLINLRAQQGELTDEELKEYRRTMHIEVDGKPFEISAAFYPAMTKSIQDMEKANQKENAMKALQGMTVEEMTTSTNLNNFMIAAPNAFTTWMNRQILDDSGKLSDSQYRYYADTHVNLTDNILAMRDPDPALIKTANNLGHKLQNNFMLLSVPPTGVFKHFKVPKAVTVTLPAGVSSQMVREEAKKRNINPSEILLNIYKSYQKGQND